jgi:PAS domain S-box-containing protein
VSHPESNHLDPLPERGPAEAIAEVVRGPLLVLDAGQRVLAANQAFYKDLNVKPEDTVGCLVHEIGDGRWDAARLRSLFEVVRRGETTVRDFETVVEFEGLGRRRLLLNARQVEASHGGDPHILLSIEDVTKAGRDRLEFDDPRGCFRVNVGGVTTYGIFTFDLHGTVRTWNRGAEQTFGYSEAEMIDRDVRDIFVPEDVGVGVPEQEMQTAAREGNALDERWHLRQGGERFWGSGLVMPLKDVSDEMRGFVKIVRDMTPEKQLEASLLERTAELEQADIHKNEFLAMLGHELRNPLAAIRNVLAVAERSQAPEDLNWCLKVVGRQVRNFGHLVDDLLDVARITQGKVQLRTEIIDATPVLHGAVEAVRPLVEERGHELLLAFTSTPLHLKADATRLEQVLVNLLTNAAKYTPPGGRVELVAAREGADVVFRVRDNGVGIAPELLPQMFELFAQGSRSLNRSEGGLGIGLTLVKSLTEMHGGTVAAFSEGSGTGSEFVVRVPAARGPAIDPPTPDVARERETGRGRRVLVVDDHADTASGMARLLKLDHHEVRVAYDGMEALHAARQFRPEYILLDIGLPGMNGYDTAAILREDACCQDAVFIAVSGYGDEQTLSKSIEAGFDHHLVKPVDPETLLALIKGRDRVA